MISIQNTSALLNGAVSEWWLSIDEMDSQWESHLGRVTLGVPYLRPIDSKSARVTITSVVEMFGISSVLSRSVLHLG